MKQNHLKERFLVMKQYLFKEQILVMKQYHLKEPFLFIAIPIKGANLSHEAKPFKGAIRSHEAKPFNPNKSGMTATTKRGACCKVFKTPTSRGSGGGVRLFTTKTLTLRAL